MGAFGFDGWGEKLGLMEREREGFGWVGAGCVLA